MFFFFCTERYGRQNPASYFTQNKIWRPYHGLQSPPWFGKSPPPFRLISHHSPHIYLPPQPDLPVFLEQAANIPAPCPCTSSPLWTRILILQSLLKCHSRRGLLHPLIQNSTALLLLYLSSYHLMPPDIPHICLFVSPTWKATPRGVAGTYLVPFVHYCILCAW